MSSLYPASRHLAGGLYDLPYREARAITEVVDPVLAGLRIAGPLQGEQVRFSEVFDVDVVLIAFPSQVG